MTEPTWYVLAGDTLAIYPVSGVLEVVECGLHIGDHPLPPDHVPYSTKEAALFVARQAAFRLYLDSRERLDGAQRELRRAERAKEHASAALAYLDSVLEGGTVLREHWPGE